LPMIAIFEMRLLLPESNPKPTAEGGSH
jgi:hypothetical protein